MMRGLLAFVACALAACGPLMPDYAYTSDGRVLRAPPARQEITTSAAIDLHCAEPAIALRDLDIGVEGEGKWRRTVFVAVADGCGRRAVYRPECALDFPPDDPDAAAKRARQWPFEAKERRWICRVVLLSIVKLD